MLGERTSCKTMTNASLAKRAAEEINRTLDISLLPEAEKIAAAIIVQWLEHRESLGPTRWAKFKRWWRGGHEYGHTGNPEFRTLYRRNVRTGTVEMQRPLGWIPIHKDHWHKFTPIEIS
jgi:hypothetical protein